MAAGHETILSNYGRNRCDESRGKVAAMTPPNDAGALPTFPCARYQKPRLNVPNVTRGKRGFIGSWNADKSPAYPRACIIRLITRDLPVSRLVSDFVLSADLYGAFQS